MDHSWGIKSSKPIRNCNFVLKHDAEADKGLYISNVVYVEMSYIDRQ